MYEEGGGAGLKYLSHQMITGEKFTGKVRYKNAEDCIKMNGKCKLHYRDAELMMTPEDITAIVAKADKAIDWYEAVSKSSKSSADPPATDKGRRRRRRRRRRRLLSPVRND